jgi:DNA primase
MTAHKIVLRPEGAAMNAVLNIPAIRAAHPISSVIGASVKLNRAGGEWVGRCPFHADRTPSFTVNDAKGFAHCFGCGWHGDVLDFIQAIAKIGLREAVKRLEGGKLPAVQNFPPAVTSKAERNTSAEAVEIWRNASPVKGTPAETYLRSRGLDCAIPDSIRFARLRYGRRGPEHPVLVSVIAAPDDTVGGIQRTYLNASGTGKAAVPKPKLSLGRVRGGAIRCAPAAGEIILTEGLEDALSLQQELGQAAWATAGAGGLSSVQLPLGVRSVIIGADSDETGLREARKAASRFAAEGRRARLIMPLPGFKDFNDELRGARP